MRPIPWFLAATLALASFVPAAIALDACVLPTGGGRLACVSFTSGEATGCWSPPCEGVTCYGVFVGEGGPNPAAGSTWNTYVVRCSGDPNCRQYYDAKSALLGWDEKTCSYDGPVPGYPPRLCDGRLCLGGADLHLP